MLPKPPGGGVMQGRELATSAGGPFTQTSSDVRSGSRLTSSG